VRGHDLLRNRVGRRGVSVGSMTYAGSMPIDGGTSTLGRLTANVLRRFLDPEPFQLPTKP